jgi:hypothetical protein
MPLPSSGTIKISQIRSELGTSNGSLRALSALAGKSTPDAMSEFYGYSNSYPWYVKLGTTFSNACSATVTTVYSTLNTWTTGMGFWFDAARTNGVEGYNYIVLSGPYIDADKIYNLTSSSLTSWQFLGTYTGTMCSGLTSTVDYVYTSYGFGSHYGNVYYNGSNNYQYSSIVVSAITLSPSVQTIYAEAYEEFGNGCGIVYYLNGTYQTAYNGSNYISTGGIGTAGGNSYSFDIFTGVFG